MSFGTSLESVSPSRLSFNGVAARHEEKPTARYARILVPTDLSATDVPALQIGAELALAHRAALEVVAVTPEPAKGVPEGLDAVQLLHRAAAEPAATREDDAASRAARLEQFLQEGLTADVRAAIDLRTQQRQGDLANEILACAGECGADLLVLPLPPARWWRPLLPAPLWRLQQRAKCPTIFVSPAWNGKS